MTNLKTKRRFNRIISGILSAAMVMTMAPDIWLPVYAESVRNNILNTDIISDDEEIIENTDFVSEDIPETPNEADNSQPEFEEYDSRWDELAALDPYSEEYDALKGELTSKPGTGRRNARALRSATLNGNFLSNEYIAINVNSDGRFTIGTTGGDPDKTSDDNKKLLYGHPGGSTSYTTIRVNGNSYIYGINNSSFNAEEGYNVSSGSFGGLDVKQKLTLVNNPATDREDIAEIKYTVTNNTDEMQNAGLRIMLDTQLGYNDDAPFRVPQYGSITSETEFVGDNIPQFWQAFDNLTNPSVISQGRFYSSNSEKPNKVQFTNWRRVYNCAWGYAINSNWVNGDSAVSVIWDEKAIAPGETREYVTYYGLSEFTENLSLPLALSVYSDSTVSVVNGKYSPNPIDVTAYIENISNIVAEDVAVEIVLPDGLYLSDSEKTKNIGEMSVGKLEQVSWKVNIKPSSADKTYTYQVVLTAADGYTKSVSRDIFVPALKKSEKIYEYAVFSANPDNDIILNGWKGNFVGGIYSGKNFTCNLSEFYLDGKADTVGNVNANGWQINIPEKNENVEAIAMPDLEEAILSKAGDCEYHEESPTYIQDTTVINGSIMVSDDVIISSTNFEGDCYIIADGDITYNVNNLNTTGRIVLFSRNGNITVNGSNININGIMYAPKGKISFNANETTVNGRIWGDTVNFSGSIFNIKASDSDLELIGDVISEEPTIEIIPSAENVFVGDEAYFEINTTLENKITSTEYTLNGEAVTVADGKYILDTTAAGTYTLTANAVTTAGKNITASAEITVEDTSEIDTEAPVVELTFDKDAYSVGDTITAEIIATDNVGVTKLEVFVNDAETEIDENNRVKVENAAEGEYVFTVNAYDEAGNMGTASYTVTIVMIDTEAPAVTITFDKDTYLERDDIIFTVAAEDNIGVTKTVVTVDGTEITPDADGNYSIHNAELKTYEITASAYDEAGNMGTATASVPVNEASAPVITVVFDKESYSEGDDLSALITAEGQREIKEIKVLVNGEEKTLEEGGVLKIESIAAGEYVFSITAEDVKGFTSECEKAVTVLPVDTEDKRLTAEIEPFVEYGETAFLTVKITDEINVESLKVVLDDEEISLTDELTYEFKAEELFSHSFVITAQTNDGETIEKEASVYVKDSVCPTMTITYDKPDGYYEGEDIVATIVAEDNVGIKRIEYTYDGVEYPIDENGQVTIPKIHVDTHAVVATAWDTFGNSITLTSAFIVVYDDASGKEVVKTEEDVDNTELVCKIYTPKDGQTVTAPISIVGTAAGTEFKSYKLEYAPVGSKSYTLIKEGTEAVNANVLGKLDPTLMNNGLYNLKLTVYSEKKNISSEIVVSVEGNMKIGNFSIAFQDMDVNVAGLPLTVIRSYDSRSRNTKGDFGYGWDMSTSGVKINESCNMSSNWTVNRDPVGWGYYQYSITGKRAHIVTINYGNGKTEKFELEVVLPSPMSRPEYGVTLKFKPLNGSKSNLEIIGASTGSLFYSGGQIGSLSQLDVFGYTRYRLTKQDGTVYIININGEVESITEPNGSKITFNKDGIIHSDGKSIVFNRDSEGRITSIASPTGKTVTYTYDENGDLASVTDVSGEVTRFVYENHYLTEIIDPRGVRVSRNIYDDEGRLIKTIDADGNEIKYDHDINGREERVTDRNGNVTRYVYDQNGNILSQTDPNGNTIKNTYDSNGNLSTKTDAMGNVTNYSYDNGSGDLLTYTDAEGHTVTNTYNSKGQITSINAMGINTISLQYNEKGKLASTSDALGNDINYSYDSKGQLTSVTDEIGTYMNMTYDSDGNVVSAVNAAGTSYQFTYDADGNNTSKTMTYTSDGVMKTVTEQYFYDAAGNLTKIIDSDGNVTTTDYNSMGKVSSATDEKGRTTTYDYDDFGNLIGISYPDGTSERFTYDREGNNLTATDRMGRTVTMTYDKVGNLLSKTYPNGARVTYSYDANYNLVSETSAGGGVTYYEYDKIGRNTAITDALGNRTAFSYNAKSQLESMTDPMGRTYTYSYDDNGNRLRTVYPDGTSVSTEYDSRGRITRQTDQNGYSTRYTLDASDNLTRVTNAQGVSTSYTYDELGNMTSITDGNGNVTSLAYDDYGRVIRTTNALGNSAYTTYDESGNILTSTDYTGNVTTYTYDNFDRVSSKTNNDGTVSYTYTTDGKLSSVTDNSGVTMFTYDNMDGLTRVDYPDGSYVAYDYDSACRLTSVTTPFGTTSYEYDMLDRLTRVVDRNGYATIYEYDANGNRTAVRYANGYTTTYDYDLLNRLVRQETLDNDGEVVVQYIYTLGAAGERLSVDELNRNVEYTYDNLYRLTGETITEGENVTAYTYSYDNVGNRTLKTKNGAETVYTYNELNQILSEDETTYEYDLNGNVVRMISPTKSALYVYNADNRLIRATVQSETSVSVEEYEYDYAGNRTAKKSEGGYTKYLLDINGDLAYVLAETDYDGVEKCYYTRGTDLISQERDGKPSYYLTDGHGSVRALMNENGKVTDKYTYDAFGNLISSTGRTENDFLFAGEQFDAVTGLYYLRARYMNPSVGSFISMDSYSGSIDDPVSLHKYLYANANPVSNSDPSGYSSLADLNASMGIQATLNDICTINAKGMIDMVKGMFGFANDIISTIKDGKEQGLSKEEIVANVAAGLITSLIANFSCYVAGFMPPLGYILMGVAALVVGVIAVVNFSNGNTAMGIAQVINLVTIVFSMFNPTCFTGDTPVYTDDGLVCIENIEVGDAILAYNPETGETELKEVLNVWVKETDEILHVSTSDGETIDTTTNHPFYVEDKGWVAAGDLEIGDTLVTADGDTVEIADIEIEKLAEPILVYNLEVEDFHTYFVGEYGVLVHNYGAKFDENQQAVIDLAKEAKRKGGVSMSEADTLMEFAKEYKVSFHGPEIHLSRPGEMSHIWHFHIDKQGHIPILDFDEAIWAQFFGGNL